MSRIDMRDGSLRGRLAGMVGASWKGIQYVRKMVIPANPNTAAQQGTRTVFAYLVDVGRRINSTILKLFILPKPKKMSPFNEFIARNKAMIEAGVVDPETLVIGEGSLYSPGIDSFAVNEATDQANVAWVDTLQGEAQATDPVIVVVYNVNKALYGFSTNKTRTDQSADIALDIDPADLVRCYLFMVQGTELSSATGYDSDVG